MTHPEWAVKYRTKGTELRCINGNFIAMRWYYILRNKLADANLLSKFSPMEIVRHLCRVRTVYINGKWQKAETTKKEEAVFGALKFSIT